MKEKESVNKASLNVWNRCAVMGSSFVLLGATILYADIDVGFSSVLDAINQQSDGSGMDTSFTFELGSFNSGFTPTAGNTNLWQDNWNAAPGSGGSASANYTQAPLPGPIAPNTGHSNNFSGSVTLNTNASPFSTSDQAYVWGYDDRGVSGTGEWLLITNPAWLFPAVVPGPQIGGPQFDAGDAGTVAVLGSVNPEFSSAGDDPHLQSESVFLRPVPEPSSAVLIAGGIGMMLVRRRR